MNASARPSRVSVCCLWVALAAVSVLGTLNAAPAAGADALLVVGNVSLNSGDAAVKSMLEAMSYTVTAVDDSASTTGDAAGMDVVVISSTVNSNSVGDKFRNVTVPVVNWEQALLDNLEMVNPSGSGVRGTTSNKTQVAIIDSGHDMAAGLSGTVSVFTSNQKMSWGKPNGNAAAVATLTGDSSRIIIFGYDTGAAMYSGLNAPARRVHLFLENNGAAYLTGNGVALFEAAVDWATNTGAPPNVPPTADAGPDQAVTDDDDDGSEDITLDGSGSSDSDGTIVSYEWEESSVPVATGVSPVVSLSVAVHTIDLIVTDNDSATDSDSVVITVDPHINVAPTADAGPDQNVTDIDDGGDEDVTLDGSGSSDSDGTIVSYDWEESSVPIATGVSPTVTLSVAAHTIDLTVTDDDSATDSDSVVITVAAPPTDPVQLDLSGGLNMDAWCGPKEYQECRLAGQNLMQLFGGLPEGNATAVLRTNRFIVVNSSAAGMEYSMPGDPTHPNYLSGTEGSPADGVVIGGDGREYHIAGSTGNATLAGDWTEVADPSTYVTQPNIVYVGSAHNINDWQIASVTVELPAGQKRQYNNVNFILCAVDVADTARNMQIVALYGDGTDAAVVYAFSTAEGGSGPRMVDTDGGVDFAVTRVLTKGYDNPGGTTGSVIDFATNMWEFDAALTLDSEKTLWGFRFEDSNPGLNWNARGLAVFAATAVPSGANAPPVADAGPDQNVNDADDSGDEDITLDGSGSTDSDGTIVSYEWEEASVPLATGVSPLVTLSVAAHTIDLTVTDDGSATDTDSVVITVTAYANQAPTADAGPDQNVNDADDSGDEDITLDGSGSTDSDGAIVSYDWEEASVPIATGVSPTVALSVAVHTIDLTVTDDDTATDSDSVQITVTAYVNQAPTADAGPDQNVNDADDSGDENITLDGSASSDSDGTIVSHDWEEASVPIATGVSPVVALSVAVHTIDLTVTDDDSATDADSVQITVTAYVNIPPTADAGPDQNVNDADDSGDEDITLDGSASSDSDGTIVSYDWEESSVPIATGVSPVVSLSVAVHTIDLIVTDDDSDTDTDSAQITVTAYVNIPPTADAGPNQNVNDADDSGDEDITLDGSGSSDSDGTIVSYDWEESSVPIASGVSPVVSLSVAVHTIDLTVTDDDSDTDTDSVQITVTAYVNQPPAADAGPDQNVTDDDDNGSEDVTLDGSGSSDSDGTIVSYDWEEDSVPIASGVSPVVSLSVAVHTIDLTVTDDDSATDSDSVIVTVNPHINVAPTADAGPDQNVTDTDDGGDEDVTLDGSGSTDSDGAIVSYDWEEASVPIATGVSPVVTLSVAAHTIDLTVTDDDSATDSDSVAVTVNPAPSGDPVQLDLSAGLNMDAFCGPKEFQQCRLDGTQNMIDLYGGWPEGNGLYVLRSNRFIVVESSGAGMEYSISGEGNHPYYLSGTEGSPADGVIIGGDGREYHITGTSGNATMGGDMTEVADPSTFVNRPNIMYVGCTHNVNDWQVASVTAELPAGQKQQYSDINFILCAPDVADKARNMQIVALYGDGTDAVVVYAFSTADGGSGPLMNVADNGVEWSSPRTMTKSYDVSSGATGAVVNHTTYMWEFAAALTLDDQKTLWGLRIEDTNPGLNWNSRALAIFAATATPAGGNTPPVADAGPDQNVNDADDSGDEDITLDGSGSSDSDGTIVSYEWEESSVPIATGVSPVVSLDVNIHTIDLTVTDDGSATDTDSVVITVTAYVNQAPTADAGPDQNVTDTDDGGDEDVTLDGSGSSDSDGTIVSYDWEESSVPIATGVSPIVTLDVNVHTIDLTVTDDDTATDTDSVVITVAAPAPQTWSNQDIGNPAIAGSAVIDAGTITIQAAGNDIWGAADQFHFVYQSLSGDGVITARVVSLVNTNSWAKAGVMFRETLAAGSINAYIAITPANGVSYQSRLTTDGTSTNVRVTGHSAPKWLRLVRSGDTIDAYHSDNGADWALLTTDSVAMATDIYVGLAVTSHNIAALTTAVIDNIMVPGGGNVPPSADAGPDQNVTDTDDGGDEDVTLDGSASSDSDGTIVSYEWREATVPIATGVSPVVTLTVAVHTIDLIVTDNDSATDTDSVVITVNPAAGNQPPVADAGPNQSVTDTDQGGDEDVTLDGSGSDDPDGTITSYVWEENSSQIATGVSPIVTLTVAVHTIDLTVTDNDSATDTDSVTITVNAGGVTPPPTVQTISEWKSGISLDVQGTYGTDYLVEQWYHDPKIDPRCTVYINSSVDMDLFHNSRNSNITGEGVGDYILIGADGLDGIPDNGDEGVIRYRVDQNMTERAMWAASGTLYPAWPSAQSFDDMEYDPGAPVVGVTGGVPTHNITDRPNFYWRGMVDSVGDEWHVIAVGDDDDLLQSYTSNKSSDGKIYYFVVNPTTPACQIITNNASAQFYTTPPKVYFVPVIRDQTSYVLGDCDIELAALGGAAVEYSMEAEGQGASWQAYTAPINTIAAGLASDTRYELKYRIGAAGVVKTRIVHFDPAYPSDGEVHPKNILWENGETGIQRVRDRLGREPYASAYDDYLTSEFVHQRSGSYQATLYTGDRWCGIRMQLLASAFPLLMDGFDQHPECSAFMKNAMLDTFMNLDPIGLEATWNNNCPSREICKQGYYGVGRPIANALAYDWVIKDMRYPANPDGFTAVEDYKLRDNMAAWANWTMQCYADDFSHVDANGYNLGMWDGAWMHGTGIIAAVINNYDTDLYGTSGAPGGTFNVPRPWTPFPDYPQTWWDVCTDKNIAIPGYPNLGKRSTYWGLLNENLEWIDRRGYWSGGMMGWLHYLTMNFRANFDGYHFPHLDTGVKMIAEGGQIMPLKSPEEGPLEFYTAMLVNHHFPLIAPVELQKLALDTQIYERNIGFSLWLRGPLGICGYEDDWDQ